MDSKTLDAELSLTIRGELSPGGVGNRVSSTVQDEPQDEGVEVVTDTESSVVGSLSMGIASVMSTFTSGKGQEKENGRR